jgi:hypothetical protein
MARHKFFREGYPPASGTDPVTLTRPGDFAFDLNAATFEELSRIPLLGRERARAVIEARPITRWE